MNFERVMYFGTGGIGSSAITPISQVMAQEPHSPKEMVLVDPDQYVLGNRYRQLMLAQHEGTAKVEVQAARIKAAFPEDLTVHTVPKWIVKRATEADQISAEEIVTEGSIIATGFDNHPVRKTVSKAAQKLQNVIVISAGNKEYTGNVIVYARLDGEEITKPIEVVYPNEIGNPVGKNPGEMSCEERAQLPGGGQTLAVNLVAAGWQHSFFTNIINTMPRGKAALAEMLAKRSEVIFDIRDKVSALSYSHAVKSLKRSNVKVS